MSNGVEVEVDPEQEPDPAKVVRARREVSRAARLSVYIAMIWVWVELPWELLASSTKGQIFAVLVSKLIFLLAAVLTVMGSAWGRYPFLFICGLSVWAIAPALPMEFEKFPLAFILSTGEFASKAAAFLAVHDGCRRVLGAIPSAIRRSVAGPML
jgi:hypothetical protein